MQTSQTTSDPRKASSLVECDFCDEFSGGMRNYFSQLYVPVLRCRIMSSSDNFNVLPTLGQIVEGHTLIAPKAHYTAAADFPAQLLPELKSVVDLVQSGIAATYGRSIVFEHGMRGCSPGGCGVTHAHIHVLPLTPTNDPIDLIKAAYSFKTICDLGQIADTNTNTPYLYYEDTSSTKYIFEADSLPSQYVRQLLARSVGSRDWDWRNFPQESSLFSTIGRLSPLLNFSRHHGP
jgi:diadenosine tetraphosphate (Ap4A) HIT family hydrolase